MAESRQRLDKWLYFGRFARTRTAAQEMIRAGRVRVNRNKVRDPSHPVRVGDALTIASGAPGGQVRICRIEGFSERRGPYREARQLYLDLADIAEDLQASAACRPESPSFEE